MNQISAIKGFCFIIIISYYLKRTILNNLINFKIENKGEAYI